MKRLMSLIISRLWILPLFLIHGNLFGQTYSLDRLEEFYDQFVCEEKNTTYTVGLTGTCTDVLPPTPPLPPDSCGVLITPPAIPALAQAAPSLEYVPIVLVNNTEKEDSELFFVMYGQMVNPDGCQLTGGHYTFIDFTTPVGVINSDTQPSGANTPPSSDYTYAFSDIPLTNGQRILYVPYINAGILLFSIDTELTLTVNDNSIAIPVATDTGDANYLTVYGGMEITFFPPNCPSPSNPLNQLTIDFTCVDYYGFSLYLNLFTQNPAPGLPQNRPSGIYQSRHYTLCSVQNALAEASPAALSQWTGLVLKDGDKILRIVSPGYAMSHTGGTFDTNYFDNAADYGFSWANDVWTGSSAYYLTHTLTIVTNDGTQYNGRIQSGNFVFQSTSSQEQFSIPWSDMPLAPLNFTTSTALFNVAAYFPGMLYSSNGVDFCELTTDGCASAAAQARGTEITQYLSASIVAGLLPGKVNKLVPTGFPPSLIASYYMPNPNLTPPGSTTGPWYDLYSLGFFGNAANTGNAVYTYAYDDYLYSQASGTSQVAPSQLSIDSTTYVTVILGEYSDN